MFAVVKEHEDGTVTVPVVAESYEAAYSRAEQLRDAEYLVLGNIDAFSWERVTRQSEGYFACVSVGDESWEWYVVEVGEEVA